MCKLINIIVLVLGLSVCKGKYIQDGQPLTTVTEQSVVLQGQCDLTIPVVQNFNVQAYLGLWHLIESYPNQFQTGSCNNAYYSMASGGVDVLNSQVVNATLRTISGGAVQVGTEGKFTVLFQVDGETRESNLWVLATDYVSFSLLYSCRNINNLQQQVTMWKMSRTQSLTQNANTAIDNVLQTHQVFDPQHFIVVDQSPEACFYYPDYAPGEEVILPGQCQDQDITVVENFDVQAYLGQWIEIERYQQSSQYGACNRAYYSLGEGNVRVRNTQVVNQTLAERLGYAELASNDGRGVLNVTFEIQENIVYSNYHVLATDYTSYALVYSCRNVDDSNMQVFSWKLSRGTRLSPEAQAAIEVAIARTQVLSQQYYMTTSQTDADCFYIPEVDENAAPVFRGQCVSITGVANFDPERYAGWWHEIERYPVDNNRGECISSRYSFQNGVNSTYQVVDTVVVAHDKAELATGTVEVTTDGRLTRTINGQVQVIWVLATDYETYSLLYSCESADEENSYRRVWSAKHSKVRSLTPAAQTAMAPVIEANSVLYPQFYQPVDQSDEACFHYPELTDQVVILPGQCDLNIPVVANFDVGAYQGTWYQIEKYPQRYENPESTCIGARYTPDSDGNVAVLNWEVIGDELVTIEGSASLDSTDGSAKLSVVLPVVGTDETTTRNLYVLATDYESYSLVYSCSNVDEFHRRVGAWKLSRERTMPDSGTAVINAYMASRDELHEPYFIEIEQNDQCQEPSSGTFLRSSIIVMLICAVWQMLS